ncbi:MAG: glutamate formimidoyltransferase [Anaerolineae bacterium]
MRRRSSTSNPRCLPKIGLRKTPGVSELRPLVECVPNFSEGRRRDVIDTIVGAMREIPEVQVLDVQSDEDHNRSVVTLVGPPAAVQDAAFQGIKTAARLIDMEQHHGEHPRLGATDVVPFVPIQGVPMDECVAMARELGRRVGEELDIPIYLYEQAATRPDRANLANIRRGEYEALKTEIATNPERAPDFGPKRLGSAGATVIGARSFLIAFNAYLNTADVGIARRIARAVRHSNGGYHYLKAIGILVAGQAQVSMNFTDFEQTPLYRVMETVRREAARYGAAVTHTELVGLIPEKALVETAQWHLQLDYFEPDQMLERRLRELDETPPRGFLSAVAAATPTPAGGSVAALAGALCAALVTMVGRLTLEKRRHADVHERVAEIAVASEELRASLTSRIDEDAAAFEAVLAAYRLPKTSPDEAARRQSAIQESMKHAIEVPLATARDALSAMMLAQEVAEQGLLTAVTDTASGAWMAMASVQAATLSVRSNLRTIEDQAFVERVNDEVEGITSRAEELLAQIQETTTRRLTS